MIRHLLGWMTSAFRFSREPCPGKSRPPSAVASSGRQTSSPSVHTVAQAILGRAAKALGWREPLVLVTPRAVVSWHRAGCRLYRKWLSRTGGGSLFANKKYYSPHKVTSDATKITTPSLQLLRPLCRLLPIKSPLLPLSMRFMAPGASVNYEKGGSLRCRRSVGRVTVTNVVGLPCFKNEMRSVSHFDVQKATQTQNDVSFGTPLIGNISGTVLDHSHTNVVECAASRAYQSFLAGMLRKRNLGPVRNGHRGR